MKSTATEAQMKESVSLAALVATGKLTQEEAVNQMTAAMATRRVHVPPGYVTQPRWGLR